jgi:hypothetical protein
MVADHRSEQKANRGAVKRILVRGHGAGCIAPQRVPLVTAAPRKIHSDYECEQAIE